MNETEALNELKNILLSNESSKISETQKLLIIKVLSHALVELELFKSHFYLDSNGQIFCKNHLLPEKIELLKEYMKEE